jgi:hypothetical protein
MLVKPVGHTMVDTVPPMLQAVQDLGLTHTGTAQVPYFIVWQELSVSDNSTLSHRRSGDIKITAAGVVLAITIDFVASV